MSSRFMSIGFGCWIALLTATYYLVEPARRPLWVLIGFSAAGAVVVGVRRYRPARRRYWLALAAAMALFVAADLVTPFLGRQWRSLGPESLFVDVFYLGVFAGAAVALTGFARWSAGSGRASLLDGLALVSAAGVISWTLLIAPRLGSPTVRGLNTIEQVAAVAYPLGDLILLAMMVRLVVGARWTVPVVLLGAGGLAFYTANVYYQGTATLGSWVPGGPADFGWIAFLAAWGLAALHPGMGELTRPGLAQSGELTVQRLLLLAVCGLIPPALLTVEAVRGPVTNGVAIGAALVVIVSLALARLIDATRQNRRALRRERTLREAGARLVAATGPEDVRRVVEEAVADLLPPNTQHQVVMETPDGAGGQADAPVVVRMSAARPGAHGTLHVTAPPRARLAELQPSLGVLAFQAGMAMSRIALTAEVNRRNSEAYFRTLVHNASDVILILDQDGGIRYGSPSAAAMFGDPAFVGSSFLDRLAEDDRAEVAGWLRQPEGTPEEHRAAWTVRGPAGHSIEVEASGRDLRADATVGGLVLTLHDVTERRELERELTHRAFHDPLTGLANRALFAEQVAAAHARSRLTGALAGVILIDLDDFKMVNDTLGHPIGDELLVKVSARLRDVLRPGDVAARLGGDEFAILIEDAADLAAVEKVASRVVWAMAVPVRLNGHLVRSDASVGVATADFAADADELMSNADLALYEAKGAGKGRWRSFRPELHIRMMDRMNVRTDLDRAIRAQEFSVRFQPIVRLSDGRPVGMEALARWEHPERGTLPPDQFVPVAEETGLIVPIGSQVLRHAVAAAATWPAPAPYVGVNVSARQFRTVGMVAGFLRELQVVGLPPERAVLEITETLLLHEDEQVWSDLAMVRRAGVRVAIDDFGTGYSSLSYLRQTALDMVKIDRSFIHGLDRSPSQLALVDGIIRIARTLGLDVVAEGVETPAERAILTELGCEHAQGYLFSRPMTQGDTAAWLARD
ncbi:EAL domain-containing protein [Longispora sp. K20-0274]|uniref:putative bifunctional diguanylate cyclase/phosphodiesterase n=1 Tax=Longispora sp. K20-0274 TaxID=3088255 RepID=UPI00399B2F13